MAARSPRLAAAIAVPLLAVGACQGPYAREPGGGDPGTDVDPVAPRPDGGGGPEPGRCATEPCPDASSTGEACVGIRVGASPVLRPLDMVWVVDSSNSMDDEAASVQRNLAALDSFITESGIDFRTVMVSAREFVTPSERFETEPARFRFVDLEVPSRLVFGKAIEAHAAYADFLRPDAATHVVGVADDDDGMLPTEFITALEAALGHAFVFHAIASEPTPNPNPWFGDPLPCRRDGNEAFRVGYRYYEAATLTGGQQASICTADWAGVFSALAAAAAEHARLPCSYELPEPPAGMALDLTQINVDYVDPDGHLSTIPFVESAAACGSIEAWHFDDASRPTHIELCDAACSRVAAGGDIDIRLACDTVPY